MGWIIFQIHPLSTHFINTAHVDQSSHFHQFHDLFKLDALAHTFCRCLRYSKAFLSQKNMTLALTAHSKPLTGAVSHIYRQMRKSAGFQSQLHKKQSCSDSSCSVFFPKVHLHFPTEKHLRRMLSPVQEVHMSIRIY